MWSELTESEKLETVKAVIEGLVADGEKVTGRNVGDRVGAAERTGRAYLRKLEEISEADPRAEDSFYAFQPRHVDLTEKDQYTAVILSDMQCDLQDDDYLSRVLQLVEDIQPDKIVSIGDETDATSIGRWSQGTKLEYESNLQTQLDVTHDYLRRFREAAPNASFQMCQSNHMLRFSQSIESRLPGFRSLRALTPASLLGLDDLGIVLEEKPFEVFPGVIACHGHEFGLTSANQYQKSAQIVARSGVSVCAGHTHRGMLTSVALGYNFDLETRFFLGVGCSMDMSQADYIKSRAPEWSHGTGVLTYNAKTGITHPELVLANSKQFYYNGMWY